MTTHDPTDPPSSGDASNPADPAAASDVTDAAAGNDATAATEVALRDTLDARASSVEPGGDGWDRIEAALAVDAVAHRRRNRALVGTGIAAAVVAGVVAAAVLRGDGGSDRVISTATEPAATEAPTTGPGRPSSTLTTTTAPAVTATVTATSVPTTEPPTTATTGVPTTTLPTLPGGSTAPEAGSGRDQGIGTALVTAVRVGHADGYDRLVIELGEGGLPGWSIEYVDPPITMDGSGQEVSVAGSAYLRIRLERAAQHDPSTGAPTYTGPSRVSGGTTEVTEAVATGDFEGVVSWVVGVRGRVPFRVSTLSGPTRLVVDVAAP
jgi:hypothetical protein